MASVHRLRRLLPFDRRRRKSVGGDLVKHSLRGTAFGLYTLIIGIGAALALTVELAGGIAVDDCGS
jgi:hypothetical protein